MVTSVVDKIPEVVYEIIEELGIPANIKGYNYVAYAIYLVVEDPTKASFITKQIYPDVAKAFDSVPTRVERAIRHAIERITLNADRDVFYKYFSNTVSADKGKPTNSHFIATIARHVRKRLV